VRAQLRRWASWLSPGIGVKRWGVLMVLGVLLVSAGAALIVNVQLLGLVESVIFQVALSLLIVTRGLLSPTLFGAALILAGALVGFIGLRGAFRSIASALIPPGNTPLIDVLRQQRRRSRGRRVVVVGGGTGLSTLLRGLKAYTENITAVVTVFDDGGSSGRLRRELGILPPGDIRDCLVALAESEPLMTQLFEYRFQGGALEGHAFGNLFIASLAGVTGDLENAVRQTSKVLNIKGRVLPSAVEDVVLVAEFTDGTVVEGESQITKAGRRIRRVALKPADVAPAPEVLAAIADAELIVLGPGSLYTSVIPNLLVRGVADAVRANRSATRLYVCNVMTQPGETDGYAASDHVRALQQLVAPDIVTHALVNTQPPRQRALLARYEGEGAHPVAADLDAVRQLGVTPIAAALISEEDVVRHDPEALARALVRLLVAGAVDGVAAAAEAR